MSKRRKKNVWIDDPCVNPVQDIKNFARLLKEQRTDDIVRPCHYYNDLFYKKWLQSQDSVL